MGNTLLKQIIMEIKKNILFLSCLCFSLLGCGQESDLGENSGKDPANTIVIMSYNTRHCSPYEGSSVAVRIDVPGIANVIKKIKPDVVMLQEVDSMTRRAEQVDQVKELARLVGYPYYKFFKQKDYQGGGYGAGIISKHELRNIVNHPLPRVIDGQLITGSNVLGTAEITFNGKTIRVATTHVSVQPKESKLQFPGYVKILTSGSVPTVVGGDFNSVPQSEVIQMLDASGFERTNHDPSKLTIPSTAPARELDYIAFYPKSAFSIVAHHVIAGTQASDHLPIVSIINVK